jgi:FKBP-type peptidyl-prolyl cis-trans isomerase FkpA
VKRQVVLAIGMLVVGMTLSSANAQTAASAAADREATSMSASGLIYRSPKDGGGAAPAATDTVRVHYRGTFPDGREFDSSIARGKPAEFPLNRVIICLTEGLQPMKVGGKPQLIRPPIIAYGERARHKARSYPMRHCISRSRCWTS